VFDNKSKFGSLVKEGKMELNLNTEQQQAIQIGRTVLILELNRHNDIKEKIRTQKQLEIKNMELRKNI
jgi:hypothetical protein